MSQKMERFTVRARRALSLAQEAAEDMHHALIEPEHLLLGLIREQVNTAAAVLRDAQIDEAGVASAIREHHSSPPPPSPEHETGIAQDTKKAIEFAVDEARRMGHNYIGAEHLLLGILRLQDGFCVELIRRLGSSPEAIRSQVRLALQTTTVAASEPPDEEALKQSEAAQTASIDQAFRMLLSSLLAFADRNPAIVESDPELRAWLDAGRRFLSPTQHPPSPEP